MKKFLPFIIVLLLVVVGIVVATTNKDDQANTTNPPTPPPQSQTETNNQQTNNTNTSTPATDKVSIANMAFSPATLTVKKGTRVTWTNNDSVAHTVTADIDTEHGPNSESIEPGETYSFTFDDEGTYAYHCKPHPSMTAKVIVTE